MKLREIIESKDVLAQLNQSKGMTGVVAYRIGKNIKMLDAELEEYDKARIHILEKYSNKDDKGNPIIENNNYDIDQENLAQALNEINDLLDEESTLDLKKVSIEDISIANLSPKEMMAIEYMLEENDEGEDYE